jgi:hypothetical protein
VVVPPVPPLVPPVVTVVVPPVLPVVPLVDPEPLLPEPELLPPLEAVVEELVLDDPDPQAHRISSRTETRSTSIHLFIGSTIPSRTNHTA